MDKRNIHQLVQELKRCGQEHILQFIDQLDEKQQQILLRQVNEIDFKLLEYCRSLLQNKHQTGQYVPGTLQPIKVIELPKTPEEMAGVDRARACGEQTIAQGKVAVMLVAGGQGTRLGYDGPKGTFPVGPVTGRTLFQYHTEKILALERRLQTVIPFYIMTSELNYSQTTEFFVQKHYFGKDKGTIIFFRQGMLPALSDSGKMFLEEKGKISVAPDGHGGLLRAMFKNNILEDMEKRGIDYIFYFQVDSPLTQVCDPVFIGNHVLNGAEISAKTVYKSDAYEKLGNIGQVNGRTVVIEYSELSEQEKEARNADGRLVFGQGSIGIHVFSVSFLRRLKDKSITLPYHLAHKKIPWIDAAGNQVKAEKPNGFKFEQFIFDALPFAETIMVQETDRKQDFSPIKNRDGQDSPEQARQDLENLFGSWLEKAGIPVKRDNAGNVLDVIEISPLVAMNEKEFLDRQPEPQKITGGYLYDKAG